MKHITEQHMLGMLEGLQKEAGPLSTLRNAILPKAIGLSKAHLSTPTKRMLAGGAVGAAIGAGTGEDGTRFQRGLAGGALGAGAVGLGHLATKSGREEAKKTVGNFWDRSKYQFTGKGLEGSPEARVQKAREIGLIPKLEENPSARAQAMDAAHVDALHPDNDWLSIPGFAHGMVTKPGQVLKNSWNRMDRLTKGLTAASGVSAAADLIKKPDPEGPGRLEKTLGNVAGTVGFAGPAGLIPGMLTGGAAGKAGQRIGRVGDRLMGHMPTQSEAYNPAYENAPGMLSPTSLTGEA
jgi:hypothetical protein